MFHLISTFRSILLSEFKNFGIHFLDYSLKFLGNSKIVKQA
jgi:hypothetical protein